MSKILKVRTTGGTVVEGEAYSVDPVTLSLVLKTSDDFIIINASNIESIEGNLNDIQPRNATDPEIRYFHSITSLDQLLLKNAFIIS
jgi:hypothetical protein